MAGIFWFYYSFALTVGLNTFCELFSTFCYYSAVVDVVIVVQCGGAAIKLNAMDCNIYQRYVEFIYRAKPYSVKHKQ